MPRDSGFFVDSEGYWALREIERPPRWRAIDLAIALIALATAISAVGLFALLIGGRV